MLWQQNISSLSRGTGKDIIALQFKSTSMVNPKGGAVLLLVNDGSVILWWIFQFHGLFCGGGLFCCCGTAVSQSNRTLVISFFQILLTVAVNASVEFCDFDLP